MVYLKNKFETVAEVLTSPKSLSLGWSILRTRLIKG